MSSKEIHLRLHALREYMSAQSIEAFIIPSTDAHLSEYPAKHWEARVWISDFTGSAGTVVVTKEKAGLWTDSRYFLQAEEQLRDSTITLYKEGLPETPSITDWLITELKAENTVGIDGGVFSAKEATLLIQSLKRHKIKVSTQYDPFDTIWINRPSIPENHIYVLPEEYSGESAYSKINRVRTILSKEGVKSIIVSTLDTIAWLFNIRGNDVKCNPVAVCFAYISDEETIIFTNPKKITYEVKEYLKKQNVTIADYDKFYSFISNLNETICVDSSKITWKTLETINKNELLDIASPIDLMKSQKNKVELQGFRNAMTKDGVALVKFLMWLETTISKQVPLEEIDIPSKLTEYRQQQKLYVGESFDTIAGYAGNGAIVHYHVTPESSKKIQNNNFLLIDSGAQYFDGTTDITRTLALGEPTVQMKQDYTLVLKGHIQLALAIFPKGTRGSQLDVLARKSLWEKGLNYLHGTGHGIGHFLNVHEGPQNIRMNENSTTLEIGMVTSNEPGLYRDGEYGIRLENLIVTQHETTTQFGDFYSFETITLCPFDTKAIDSQLLTVEEKRWLNAYHKKVFGTLSPFLTEEEKVWLKQKTNEL